MYRLRLFVVAFIALGVSILPAHAQHPLHNSDVSLSVFGQFSSTVSGNGITQSTSDSVGGQGAFRHSYHWWLGYEGSYAYTRFNEYYTGQPYPYQHNLHDFSGAYLVTAPGILGLHPFAEAGVSALIFSPVTERWTKCLMAGAPSSELQRRRKSGPVHQSFRNTAPIPRPLLQSARFWRGVSQHRQPSTHFRANGRRVSAFLIRLWLTCASPDCARDRDCAWLLNVPPMKDLIPHIRPELLKEIFPASPASDTPQVFAPTANSYSARIVRHGQCPRRSSAQDIRILKPCDPSSRWATKTRSAA